MFQTTAAHEAAKRTLSSADGASTDTLVADRGSDFVDIHGSSLFDSGEPGESVVCECLQVRLATLQGCMDRGCTTQEDLARETGVTTICGGCEPRVAQLIGRPSGYPAEIVEIREILPTVRSFRFAADPGHTPAVVYPGQHVIISAFIDGAWVSRPYTLTSPPKHRVQEITVKLEQGGILSHWLFERRPGDSEKVQITPPQGNFCIDLDRREPIVFLAAGIGITPAISLARTFASRGGHLVHIDYTARHPEGFAFEEELRELGTWCESITTNFRVSSHGERLTEEEVRELRWRFPRGRFYVCGPKSYQNSVQAHLAAARVDPSRIHVETFVPLRSPQQGAVPDGHNSAEKRTAAGRYPNAGSQVTGLILLLLYVAQGLAGWEWPWMEALQANETYRRWSGGLLLALIALQWTLPILRVSVTKDFRAVKFAYRWHRWAGALSPVLFYAHATWLGFGYLLALASVYLVNVGIGLWDKTLIQDLALRERYVRIWLVPHVALACLTVGLTLFHIYVVFAYQ